MNSKSGIVQKIIRIFALFLCLCMFLSGGIVQAGLLVRDTSGAHESARNNASGLVHLEAPNDASSNDPVGSGEDGTPNSDTEPPEPKKPEKPEESNDPETGAIDPKDPENIENNDEPHANDTDMAMGFMPFTGSVHQWDDNGAPIISDGDTVEIHAGATGTLELLNDVKITIISTAPVNNGSNSITLDMNPGSGVVWEADYVTAESPVTVELQGSGVFEVADGGLIKNTTGFAIKHTGTGDINVTGGLVIAHGSQIVGATNAVVDGNISKINTTGCGAIIAYIPSTNPPRIAGTATELVSLPANVATWGKGTGTQNGININTGTNQAFFDLGNTVTVNANKHTFTLTMGSGSKIYDGDPLTVSTARITNGVLMTGDVLSATRTATSTITQVGTVNNVINTHTIMRGGSKGVNVTNEYLVTNVSGTLTVTQRPITITAESDLRVHSGAPLTRNAIRQTANLVCGHRVDEVIVTGEITDEGSVPNVPSNAIIRDKANNNVTANYAITYANGTLTVTKSGGDLGTHVKWAFNPASGHLSITGIGSMLPDATDWSTPGDVPWHDLRKNIKTVNIADGVKSIGNYAFRDTGITSIAISKNVENIGADAFENANIVIWTDPNSIAHNYAVSNNIQFVLRHRLPAYAVENTISANEKFGIVLDEKNNIDGFIGKFYPARGRREIRVPSNAVADQSLIINAFANFVGLWIDGIRQNQCTGTGDHKDCDRAKYDYCVNADSTHITIFAQTIKKLENNKEYEVVAAFEAVDNNGALKTPSGQLDIVAQKFYLELTAASVNNPPPGGGSGGDGNTGGNTGGSGNTGGGTGGITNVYNPGPSNNQTPLPGTGRTLPNRSNNGAAPNTQAGTLASGDKWAAKSGLLVDSNGDFYYSLDGSGDSLEIRFEHPFEEFEGLSVNDQEWELGVDYLAKSGSTIIEISAERLQQKEEGIHTKAIMFRNETIEISFELIKLVVEIIDDDIPWLDYEYPEIHEYDDWEHYYFDDHYLDNMPRLSIIMPIIIMGIIFTLLTSATTFTIIKKKHSGEPLTTAGKHSSPLQQRILQTLKVEKILNKLFA